VLEGGHLRNDLLLLHIQNNISTGHLHRRLTLQSVDSVVALHLLILRAACPLLLHSIDILEPLIHIPTSNHVVQRETLALQLLRHRWLRVLRQMLLLLDHS